MNTPKKKIVFIGGHHTSALAVVQELLVSRKDVELFWIGHKFVAWGDKNSSLEYREITALNIPFYNLNAGKFYRIFNPVRLVRIPFGFIQAMMFLIRIRPQLIVSFGGYLAVPVAFCAYILKIPIITHEQTVTAGWANKFVSRLASKVLLTWDESLQFFPKSKSRVIGLPMSNVAKSQRVGEDFDPKLKIILITGGKQGSHIINMGIKGILPKLLEEVNVIWQCGDNSVFRDFSVLSETVQNLPTSLKKRVALFKFLNRDQMLWCLKNCALLVGRSGAHTIFEICSFNKPALLIPLPNTSHNEQEKNALFARDLGICEILLQKDLNEEKLFEKIGFMLASLDKYSIKRSFSLPKDASKEFVKEINTYL